MATKRPEDELDHMELSRRNLADMEEFIVDFQMGMNEVIDGMHAAKDAVQVEAMGMTPRAFGEDVPIKLRDAIYLPVLGGEVLRNGQRIASQTYKVSSLERAIRQGHLEGRMDNNKMCVTIRALTDWIARGAPSAAPKTVRQPQTAAAVTARETERKIGSKQSALSAIDALLGAAKKKK
jgi:hypothetical protein